MKYQIIKTIHTSVKKYVEETCIDQENYMYVSIFVTIQGLLFIQHCKKEILLQLNILFDYSNNYY